MRAGTCKSPRACLLLGVWLLGVRTNLERGQLTSLFLLVAMGTVPQTGLWGGLKPGPASCPWELLLSWAAEPLTLGPHPSYSSWCIAACAKPGDFDWQVVFLASPKPALYPWTTPCHWTVSGLFADTGLDADPDLLADVPSLTSDLPHHNGHV